MPGNFQITAFDYTKEAKPGELIGTCSGEAINTGEEDYGGVAIQDNDTGEIIQSGVTDQPVPSGWTMSWEAEKDYSMPNRDVHATCYVGYYVPEEQAIYATDSRDFTIRKKAFAFPSWGYAVIGLGAVALVLLLPKKNGTAL